MDVQICVGSSCHLKGSYNVIRAFQRLVEEYGLQDEIELKAAFCKGRCTEGVSTMFGDEFVGNVTPDNAVEVFRKYALDPLGKG